MNRHGCQNLFELIKASDPQTQVVYLSNAIHMFSYDSHAELLENGDFPQGELILRTNPWDRFHKIKTLRLWMQNEKPDRVILFGDNGEQDPEIYEQIKKEYPKIQFIVFIRQMYSALDSQRRGMPLKPEQIGFVSPIEPSLVLQQIKVLNPQDVTAFISSAVPDLISRGDQEDQWGQRGPLYMPRWQDCRDFKFPPIPQQEPLILKMKERLQLRCSKAPAWTT